MVNAIYNTWRAEMVLKVMGFLHQNDAYGYNAVDVLKETIRYAYEEAFGETPSDDDFFCEFPPSGRASTSEPSLADINVGINKIIDQLNKVLVNVDTIGIQET